MSVQLKIPASLRQYTAGHESLACEAGTLTELLGQIRSQHPELAGIILDEKDQLNAYIQLYIDGANVRQAGVAECALTDTTELLLIAPVAGG